MARGRILSPDFWSDAKIVKLSPYARLFYQGMWNFAYCDKGHLQDDPEDLKLKILPADQVDPHELLTEILESGRVVRIDIGEQSFLFMPTFEKNQSSSADGRWKSRCPACKSLETPDNSPVVSSALENSRWRGGERRGVEGEGNTRGARPPRYCPQHPQGTDGGCFKCRDARIAQQAWDEEQKREQKAAPNLKRPRKGDGHTCIDQHGWCSLCGEKVT